MFIGINSINIDAKSRISMPARYRDSLQQESAGRMVITIDTDERCLLLYPIQEWEKIEAQLAQLPSFNRQARRIQRLLIGHAAELELDSNGRLLLSRELVDHAGLKKQAVLIGQGKKFELWDEAHWQTRCEEWLEEEANSDSSTLPDEVKSLSL